jgi:tetratricopeptide (TPR) repeat protein
MNDPKLQSLDSIGPVGGQPSGPKDEIAKEYEEGKGHLERQEYGLAAVALHNALVGYQEKGDEAGIANASNQLGHVCLARQEYDKALKHYERALGICDKANDRMSVLAVLKKIVAAHRGLKHYDKAIAACFDMLDHYRDNRDPHGTMLTLEEIAAIYLDSGDREKAADTYRTMASIHKNFGHHNIAAGFMQKASEVLANNS